MSVHNFFPYNGKQDISYEEREELKTAWDNFALRTEDGATKFLATIQNEE